MQMKSAVSIIFILLSACSAFSQYKASWGNNPGGHITREELFRDSLVLSSSDGSIPDYQIKSFKLSYGFSGGDWEYTIQSNKLSSYMKDRFRSFPVKQRFYIENIVALIDSKPLRINGMLSFQLIGPEACLFIENNKPVKGNKVKMSKKQFLENDILDVYSVNDYSFNSSDRSTRIDTTFTIVSYIFSYKFKNKSLSEYIKVNSNYITDEIKDIVKGYPNYKYTYDYQNFTFSSIRALDPNGDIVSVKSLSVRIPKEYEFPDINKVHTDARNIMADSFLFNKNDKTAPFGTAVAVKTFNNYYDWRNEHKTSDPEEFLMRQIQSRKYPLFDLSKKNYGYLKSYIETTSMHFSFLKGIDALILTVAFSQLYLEGKTDNKIVNLATNALLRQLNPKILNKWPQNEKKEREQKLKKMLEIIKKLK